MPDTPIFEKTEKLEASGGVQPFGEFARQSAANTNIMSSLGNQLAMGASVQRATLSGIELGKDPKGDVIPAITKSDKAFEEAYRNQASATLGLQAQELLDSSMQTIASANRLTPQLIQEFDASMNSGLSKILENSPSQDRQSLSDSFQTQLLKANSGLKVNLLEQNKKDNLTTALDSQQNRAVNLFNAGASEDKELASNIAESIIESWNVMADSGQISRTEANKNIRQVQSGLRVANMTGSAFAAEREGDYAEFIANQGANKPDGVSISEHIDDVSSVMKIVSARRAASSEHRSSVLSIGKAMAKQGNLPEDYLSEAKKTLTSKEYAELVTTASSESAKRNKKQNSVNFIEHNWGDGAALSSSSPSEINEVFLSMSDRVFHDNLGTTSEMSLEQAKATVASEAGVMPEVYANEITSNASSENPERMDDASRAIESLRQNNVSFLGKINTKALDNNDYYQDEVSNGVPKSEAIQNARTAIYKLDKTTLDTRKEQLKDYSLAKGNYNNVSSIATRNQKNNQRAKWVKNKIGINTNNITDSVKFSREAQLMFDRLYLSHGNEALAEKQTRDRINATYGDSMMNSQGNRAFGLLKEKPIFSYKPLERELGIEDGNFDLANELIAEQLTSQFITNNESSPDSRTYTWEAVAGKKTTAEEYSAAKAEIEVLRGDLILNARGQGTGRKTKDINSDIDAQRKIVKAFTTTEPLKVKRTNAAGLVEEFFPFYDAQTGNLTPTGQQIYDVKLQSPDGGVEPMSGIYSVGLQGPVFVADKKAYEKKIYEQYISDNGNSRQSAREIQESMKTEGQRKQEAVDFIDLTKDENMIGAVKRRLQLSLGVIGQQFDDMLAENKDSIRDFVSSSLESLNSISPDSKDLSEFTGSIQSVVDDRLNRITSGEIGPSTSDIGEREFKFLEGLRQEIFDNGMDASGTDIESASMATIQDERINDGKPTNIPTQWNGEVMTDEGAIELAVESGNQYESFSSIEAGQSKIESNAKELSEEVNEQILLGVEDAKDNITKDLGAQANLTKVKPSNFSNTIKDAAIQTGVQPLELLTLAQIESSFDEKAKAKGSSASGAFQFTNIGWKDVVKNYGKRNGVKLSDRGNSKKEAIMAAELLKHNRTELKKSLKREPTVQEVYIAHFAGLKGAKRAISAFSSSPDKSTTSGFSAAAIRSNPEILKGKTMKEAFDEIDKRLGDAEFKVSSL